MYNSLDLQFAGKHDFDKIKAESMARWARHSFTINIFQWILTSNGKSLKRSKGLVRVKGCVENKENAFATAELIVNKLDAGEWDGRKTVTVK